MARGMGKATQRAKAVSGKSYRLMLELPAAPIMQPLKPEEQWVQLTLKEEWKEDWTYYVGNPSNWEMMVKNWTPLRRLESEIEGSNVFPSHDRY